MSDYEDTTYNLISFFRKLADDIENNNLTIKQLISAGQMFVKYNFEDDPESNELSDEAIQQYLCTGWFVHKQMQANSANPQN